MKVGIIGFEGAGKSTLYRAAAQGHAKGDVTAVPVPDPRFDRIVAQVNPKKITPATVILHDDLDDIRGIGGKMFSQPFLDATRRVDLLLHVVRAFDSPAVPYYAEVDALRDQTRVDEELILADLQIVENRLDRLQKSMNAKSPGHPEYGEKMLFERLRQPLEEGKHLRELDLSDDEQGILKNYTFATTKPMVVVFNVPEDQAAKPSDAILHRIAELVAGGTQAFAVCATFEEELSQLDESDQPEFLTSMGLAESASAKVIRAAYDAMGLLTFFTAGENETRAWTMRRGGTAIKAAATIHNDIAKGFIRCETVHYADYDRAGSLDAAYAANKMHLEGKEYVMQDGDLIHIRNKS